METPTNLRDTVEADLLDLASIFCSMGGYASPTGMRYSLFIQKDGNVGDEMFSYHEKPAVNEVPLKRLRALGIIGLCTVHVQAESNRYYGIHLSVTDPRFSPTSSPSGHPATPSSYYLSKVIRMMDGETGQPDFRNIQPVR